MSVSQLPPGNPEQQSLAQIASTSPYVVGSFRFWIADQRWEWSEQVAQLHGYEPRTMEPTTEMVLSHKHPDDRDTVAAALAASVRHGEPFCSRHRIIDTHGAVRQVLVVGDRIFDSTGATIGTTGYFIDLTAQLDENRNETIHGALSEIAETRAAIEQAKGVLMFVYGITADQAFGVLRWRSMETNTKIRTLATKIVTAVTAGQGAPVVVRTRFDHLLLTAHELPDPPVDS
ncbi:PAS and ANTAR domain-containing protein [Nocardia beijingensis]|uniref:PAS and ANTAR domain-containing protein n=1 Tax=Nocardia beijingensis TaxID=95162 RepID=UPI00344C9F32